MKTVSVFCGATVSAQKKQQYFKLAYRAGKLLAYGGFRIVCGGGRGLMHELCRGAKNQGGETVGFCLDKKNLTHSDCLSKRIMIKDLYLRQQKILDAGDAYLALPGGVGTFFEILEIIEKKKVGEISLNKPFVIVDKYFNDLKKQLTLSHKNGFTPEEIDDFVVFSDRIEKGVIKLKKLLKI